MSPPTFDPAGPLPFGRSVLEASAGTGKTWTIAALAARYIAEEGVSIDQMLVVTFTRAATSELRERVRSRLIEAARFLRSELPPTATDDSVLARLADCNAEERTVRIERLQHAIARFDRATITTLHGFAHRLLREFGFLSATPPDLAVDANRGDVVEETMTDLVVQRFAQARPPIPDLADLTELAGAVLTNPDAELIPQPADAEGPVAARTAFVAAFRSTVADRSEQTGLLTFDDLLIRARNALTEPTIADYTRTLMRGRYRVALIDEFQDTDRIQWDIVNTLFPAEDTTLVIIGDPKQSIYAFRGADVAAYLTAAANSTSEHTLSTNWRSDGTLITALDHLFGGVTFGDKRIPYRPVNPAPGRAASAIKGVQSSLSVRLVGRTSPVRKNKDQTLSVPAARQFIADDTAAHIVELLTTPVQLDDGGWRNVRPGDIAVLCRTGHEVDLVRGSLADRRVPAVVGRTGTVFTSVAAEHWLTLLAALEQPASTRRVRAAALTPFVGWTLTDLLQATDEDLLPLHDQITRWAALVDSAGIAALWKTIERANHVSERILSAPGGERLATDLDHLTEILHTARRSGARYLHDWLTTEIQRAAQQEEDSEVRSRRLETDADAVQVLTVHAAKGLEFPIVLCPFLWNSTERTPKVPVYHDPSSDRRLIGVGGSAWDGLPAAQQAAKNEGSAEEMRLAYVALTRARHHVAVWWAACNSAKTSLISRLLFGRPDDGSQIRDQIAIVSDERLLANAQPLATRSGGELALTAITSHPATSEWKPTQTTTPQLAAATFTRTVDHSWQRTSFSGITAKTHHPAVNFDPEARTKTDEPQPDPAESPAVAGELPMAGIAGGTRFGTLVHDILERVDFTSADLTGELAAVCTEEIARRSIDVDPDQLASALVGVINTPLSSSPNSHRLRDLADGDRLSEMEFEMPCLAPAGPVGVSDVGRLLRLHLNDDHPLRSYADRLDTMDAARFRGYLTGSIDLVARVGQPEQYWVVDYKTNRLNWTSAEPSIGDYSPLRMAEAMIDGDYVLQSLIYQVALHRFLRFRIPDYTVERHLGGSLYLFVRGMIGPDTPVTEGDRYGVATWTANPDLIAALSDLFDHGVSE